LSFTRRLFISSAARRAFEKRERVENCLYDAVLRRKLMRIN